MRTHQRYDDCPECREKQQFAFNNPCCETCKRALPLSEYDTNKRTYKHDRYNDCRECRTEHKHDRRQKYYEENKDIINEQRRGNEAKKEYNNTYYNEHKTQISEARSVKIECGCGATVSKNNKSEHLKSNKHINWAKTQ